MAEVKLNIQCPRCTCNFDFIIETQELINGKEIECPECGLTAHLNIIWGDGE